LSSDMRAREPYELGMCDPIACKINVGFEMIFFYDEGSSTRVAVTVDAVEPLDANLSETSSFPRVKGTDVGTSTDVIEQPTDNVLDALFPSLQKTVFDPAYGKCFFGSCRDDLHGAIEAGLCQNGDQVYCPLRFGKFEDFLILMKQERVSIHHSYCYYYASQFLVNIIIYTDHYYITLNILYNILSNIYI